MFDQKLLYIHQNPVQAGFVTKEEDWKYRSARDFVVPIHIQGERIGFITLHLTAIGTSHAHTCDTEEDVNNENIISTYITLSDTAVVFICSSSTKHVD